MLAGSLYQPSAPAQRRTGVEFGRPIVIGRDVWVGSGAIVLPGVTIGGDTTIGVGSIATRDLPARATARGNPAQVGPQRIKADVWDPMGCNRFRP